MGNIITDWVGEGVQSLKDAAAEQIHKAENWVIGGAIDALKSAVKPITDELSKVMPSADAAPPPGQGGNPLARLGIGGDVPATDNPSLPRTDGLSPPASAGAPQEESLLDKLGLGGIARFFGMGGKAPSSTLLPVDDTSSDSPFGGGFMGFIVMAIVAVIAFVGSLFSGIGSLFGKLFGMDGNDGTPAPSTSFMQKAEGAIAHGEEAFRTIEQTITAPAAAIENTVKTTVGNLKNEVLDGARNLGHSVEALLHIRGIRNNNPGNVEAHDHWNGVSGSDGRFATFKDPKDGIRAMSIVVKKKVVAHGSEATGSDIVAKVINEYCPVSHENSPENVRAYIQDVSRRMGADGIDLSRKLNVNDERALTPFLASITSGMVHHENGVNPYEKETFAWAANAAIHQNDPGYSAPATGYSTAGYSAPVLTANGNYNIDMQNAQNPTSASYAPPAKGMGLDRLGIPSFAGAKG